MVGKGVLPELPVVKLNVLAAERDVDERVILRDVLELVERWACQMQVVLIQQPFQLSSALINLSIGLFFVKLYRRVCKTRLSIVSRRECFRHRRYTSSAIHASPLTHCLNSVLAHKETGTNARKIFRQRKQSKASNVPFRYSTWCAWRWRPCPRRGSTAPAPVSAVK